MPHPILPMICPVFHQELSPDMESHLSRVDALASAYTQVYVTSRRRLQNLTRLGVKLFLAALFSFGPAASAANVSGQAPVVPGIAAAKVTLSNLNYVYTAAFNSSGQYSFPAVEPGLYALKAEVNGYNQVGSVSVDTTNSPAVSVPDLALEQMSAAAGTYSYTWLQDQSYAGLPKTEIAANIVQPTQVTIVGKAYQMADVSYAQELFDTYGIVLSNEGETWTQEYAFRLFSVLQRIPQTAGSGYKYNTALAPTRWILTNDAINHDIDIPTGSPDSAIRVSAAAFTYAAPFVAEINGVRGLYFSKRLHAALVRYVTSNGTDQAAVTKILTDRYGLTIETTARPLNYTQFTQESTTRFQSWFTHPEELIQIINSFEELPEGFAKIAGFKWLVRRQDGTVNPIYPEAPAIAWSVGYMEFMDTAFSSFNTAYITRLILHEKAHYLYQFVLTPAFKKTWAELGGWQYAANPQNPDYNATGGWQSTKTTEFVSAYSHDKNPNEDFAETVAFFVNNPDALKARSMEKYTFIRDTVMLSNSYVSIIRPDLTFTVLNLFPNYEYPGKITRISTQVTGDATADKTVTVEVEITPFSANSNPVVLLQGRMLGPVTPEAPVAPYVDLTLTPVENSRTIFRGSVTLTKFARSGYWTLPNITLRDSVGLERYESSLLYGWKCYINNPLQDIVPPKVQASTSSLSIRSATVEGHPVQIATLHFNVTENTGLTSYFARITPPSAYPMQQWGPFNTDGGGQRTVDFVIKDYDRTGRYTVDQIVLKDYGLNLNYTYFSTHSPLVGNADGTTSIADEPAPFLDIVTANPDTKGPELDVNRITVTSTPTNLTTPDGETLVTIKYFVRDDISGYGNNSNFILRDPQGIEHFYWFYHRNTYTEYFDGNPSAWEEYTQQVLLPRGSVPGVWGLSQMVLNDKAGNGQSYPFTETVRFDPMSTAAADLNIIGDPVSKSYAVGENVSLTINVSGEDKVTYEWYKDGISLLSGAAKSAQSLTGSGELVRMAKSVSILGAGTPKLTIINAGKDSAGTYYCIVSNSSGRVVSKAAVMSVVTTPTVTWATPTAITYGTALSSTQLNATANVPGTFTYSPTAGGVLGAGSQTLNVTFQPDDTVNYGPAAQTQTLIVGKAPLTATAANQSRVYGAANPSFTLGYTGFVNSDTATALTTAPTASTTATNASANGNYPITLTGGAAANYNLTLVSGTLTVNKAPLTLTANNQTRPYGATNPTLTFNYVGFVNNDTATAVAAPTAATTATPSSNAGTYAITLTGGSAANYTLALVPGTLTITKAAQTITFGTLAGKVYGNAAFAVSATADSGLSVSFVGTSGPITILGNTVTLSGTGSATVRATQAGNGNYEAATSVDRSFAIAKAPLTVTAANQSRVFGAANPALTFSYSGFVNTETSAVLTSAPTAATAADATSPVNTYAITLSGGSAANYTLTLVNGTLTVTQTPATITLGDMSVTYNGSAHSVSATTVPSGLSVGIIYDGSVTAPTNSGSYAVVATISDTNYTGTTAGTLTIAKAENSITFNPVAGVTTLNVPFLVTANATSGLPVTFSVVSGSATIAGGNVTPTATGNVTIRASQAGNSNYATANAVEQQFTVGKTNQAITFAAPGNRTYGDAPFAVSGTSSSALQVTISVLSGPATVANGSVTLTGAGTVLLRASQAGDSSYSAAPDLDRSFTVAKATLGATASNKTRTYGAANPAFTVSYTGFVNNDTVAAITAPTASTAATISSAVGSYPIILTGGSAANYTLTLTNGSLNVTKAALTATAANQTRIYGAANPTLTINYTGFVNADTVAAITAPVASTTATATSLPEVYPITLTGGNATNYVLTLQSGALTVTPRDYSGAYFGSFASGGHWALNVRRDNTATYIAYLPSRHSAIIVNLSIDITGAFTVTGTEIKPFAVSSVSGFSLTSPESPTRKMPTAVGDFTLAGQIAFDGSIAGQLAGLGETLSGTADGTSGPAQALAGFYTAAALNTDTGATYTIVGPSGQAVVVSTTPSAVDGAAGTVTAQGQLTATTSNNSQLSVSINAQSQTVSASLTPAGSSVPITYAGLPDTVTPVSRVLNLSVRSAAGSGSQTLIVGFVVGGAGDKNLLLRGMGPSLTSLGVANALADPVLRLHDSTGAEMANNDNWGGSATMVNVFTSVGAFVPAANSKDAALQQTVSGGAYTFHVVANGAAGVALAELYDADAVDSTAKVVNISARTQVGTGENILIAGFVITGNAPKTMLVRGLGPTLLSYGVTGVLADPRLNLYSAGTLVGSNDDWSGTAVLKAAFASVGAAPLASDTSKDAALMVTLPPGIYSAQVSGANSTTGVGLIEIFLLP